jgi:hypothetical protein
MSTIPNARLISPSSSGSVFRVIIATVDVQLELSHPVNSVLVRRFSVTFEKTYLHIERKKFALMFKSFFAFAFCFSFEMFPVLFLCFSHQKIK